ncbi:Hypothetical_protein [Hexamita inflata]|uniref:Hypothetical_protein n=1 Tax=Hexamita inflata TaxID=28002 RepID=A0AA86NPI4_9EUKA|nr:Hypothetical protein HINF_LOCUS10418 [Hexamita inflata]
MQKLIQMIPSGRPPYTQVQRTSALPPISKRNSNLSTINSSSSTLSQLLPLKTPLDTFHISTSNANVNKVLVNLQDRPSQIEQAVQLGNSWSDSNLSNISDDLVLDNIMQLRVAPQLINDSFDVFDCDTEIEQ